MEMMIENVAIAFPAIAEMQSVGDGEPAYGARFIIDPANTKMVKQIDKAMLDVAVAKWKDDGEAVLEMLVDDGKTAFMKKTYKSKKTGKAYDGFDGMFSLGSRSAADQPTVFDEYGKPVTTPAQMRSKIYAGCKVHAKVQFWAQDNGFGRRINCTLLGVMFAGDGERFGGGSAPASADDFASKAKTKAAAEDVL